MSMQKNSLVGAMKLASMTLVLCLASVTVVGMDMTQATCVCPTLTHEDLVKNITQLEAGVGSVVHIQEQSFKIVGISSEDALGGLSLRDWIVRTDNGYSETTWANINGSVCEYEISFPAICIFKEEQEYSFHSTMFFLQLEAIR